MTKASVIDLLEDVYKIKSSDLTERELAIIGLATDNISNKEVQLLQSYMVKPLCINCDNYLSFDCECPGKFCEGK